MSRARYTSKQIEDAALICQMVASSRHLHLYEISAASSIFNEAAMATGAQGDSIALASIAFLCVPRSVLGVEYEWGEAESWIRSGWCKPGDSRSFS